MALTGAGVLVLVAMARSRLFRIMRVGLVLQGHFCGLRRIDRVRMVVAAHVPVTQARLNLMVVWLHYARLRARGLHNRCDELPSPRS